MMNRTLARRYATAVYALAAEGNAVDAVGADLERVVDAIEGDETVAQFFTAPIIDRAEKERVLASAFEGCVGDVALHTLLLLVRKRREALLRGVLEEYRGLVLAARGVAEATIVSARPLSEQELRETTERISRIYGTRLQARLVVRPDLVGGIRVVVGDRVVDGTVAGRLEALARSLELTTA